jgi:hypothetical protein
MVIIARIGRGRRGLFLAGSPFVAAACAFLMTFLLVSCAPNPTVKAPDQQQLDDRYYALWVDAVAHEKDAESGRTGKTLAAFIAAIEDTYTGKVVTNWVCKPWTLQGKEIQLVRGPRTVSFECLNLDGLRGAVFSIALPAGALTEPLYNGYTVKFTGTVDKFVFAADAMKSFYVYVTASAFEIVDRSRT